MRFPRIVCFLVTLAVALSLFSEDVLYAPPERFRGMGGGRGDWMRGGGGQSRGEAKADDKEKDKEAEKKDEKDGGKKEEEKKPEEKKDEGPPPVVRPLMPERPADPAELKRMPDEDHMIRFSFKGQPWPSVLEWLADISEMSLEWEEAPAGYVDLTTRGRYTVDEVRDLLNSYLLAKGFTVMRNGELLIVVNLKKLDNSLVPRVTPAELDARGTYEFVRAFFDLDWLMAEQAAEEVKSLLSPYGKVTALKSTNRLDVLDTAGNLRRIRDLLLEEQSHTGQQRLVEEFKLRFTRAEEVLDTLHTLLGIEPKQAGGAVDPRQLMQAMMMAREGGDRGQAMMQPGKKENSVYLAVNARENSILANAPPDKMGVIRQAITAVDVPHGGKGFLADAQRVKVYRLSGLQPETLVKVLKELGSLDPTTKLEIDEKKNALVAYAPLADHLLITQLVERLDGTGRKFEVIQLRTLSAEYVAGSIITLVNGPEKQEDNNRRSRYYSYFDRGQESETTDKFWVEADIERNRLLLRANDVELAEVKALLVKLGEIPTDQRYGTQTRLIPVSPDEGMREKFEQIRSMLPNPLDIDIDASMLRAPRPSTRIEEDDPAAAGQRRARPGEPAPAAGPRSGDGPQRRQRGNRSTQRRPQASRFRFAQDRVPVAEVSESQTGEPAESDSAEEPSENHAASEAPETDSSDNDVAMEAPGAAGAQKNADEKPEPAGGESSDANEPATNDEEPAGKTPAEALRDEVPVPFRGRGFARGPQEPPPGAGELPPSAHAPIHIKLQPQGLFISSSDPEALDKLESILNSVLPPRTSYEIFTLRHTYAKDMVTLLKDVFRAEMGKESNSRTEVFDMFWNGRGSSSQQTRATLSRRRPLNFVADPVTNTVLVQGADPSQLTEIEDLIERYDRAEPPNSESVRRTKRVALRYAKAKEVADIVKDVYRDLLSPNDKALLGNQPQQPPGRERGNDNFFSAMFTYLTDDPTKSEVVPRFKGMLSVGVDERSNGVVISAPQILLTEVLEMIADLDAEAKPTRAVVRVMRVRSPGTAAQVQQALSDKAKPTAAAPAEANGQNTAPAQSGLRGQSSFGGRPR